MAIKKVTAKLGKMRKPQEFVVYPKSEGDRGRLKVQSDKSIGIFDPSTGEGLLNIKSSYHFTGAEPFTFPKEFVEECIAAQPKKGDTIGSCVVIG
jgi:hypothetical protein